jgi:hypothetical protein
MEEAQGSVASCRAFVWNAATPLLRLIDRRENTLFNLLLQRLCLPLTCIIIIIIHRWNRKSLQKHAE